MPDYYSVLGVPREANLKEIRKAYHSLARRYHPDKNPDKKDTSTWDDILKAYETLSDPELKDAYDRNVHQPKPEETAFFQTRKAEMEAQYEKHKVEVEAKLQELQKQREEAQKKFETEREEEEIKFHNKMNEQKKANEEEIKLLEKKLAENEEKEKNLAKENTQQYNQYHQFSHPQQFQQPYQFQHNQFQQPYGNFCPPNGYSHSQYPYYEPNHFSHGHTGYHGHDFGPSRQEVHTLDDIFRKLCTIEEKIDNATNEVPEKEDQRTAYSHQFHQQSRGTNHPNTFSPNFEPNHFYRGNTGFYGHDSGPSRQEVHTLDDIFKKLCIIEEKIDNATNEVEEEPVKEEKIKKTAQGTRKQPSRKSKK